MSHAAMASVGKANIATKRSPTRKTVTETKTIAIHAVRSRPSLALGRFSAWLIGSGSPRLDMGAPHIDWPVRELHEGCLQPCTASQASGELFYIRATHEMGCRGGR